MTEWSPQEQEALRALPREEPPPQDLEKRILDRLRSERLWSKRRRIRWAIAAGIAVGMFAAGFLAGRSDRNPPAISGKRYLLLLHEAPRQLSGEEAQRQISDYSRWARSARESGTLIGGEKLQDAGRLISAETIEDLSFNQEGQIGGFFMIHAANLETATRIARSSPHNAHGGVIELRPVHEFAVRE